MCQESTVMMKLLCCYAIKRGLPALLIFIVMMGSYKALPGQEQVPEVEISWAAPNSVSGHSIGLESVEFNNSPLEDILKALDPSLIFNITSSKLQTTGLNFSYKGEYQSKKEMINGVNAGLAFIGIEVEQVGVAMPVYQMAYKGSAGCDQNPFLNRIKVINRVWEGECVNLSEVARQVMEWYDVLITIDEDIVVPKITLHHDDFETFRQYLALERVLFQEAEQSPRLVTQYHYK